ncbi:iron chelate uptake ABC transporter family permease subunit [Citreicella sp. C3M06]|uniref:iron chelate uptake ABC transporter family permease subunit n=1 Tax=Citreicella sp. C3M06 TaxID=2841564 RepID=UPI001C0828FE|nr:iron chelate uptake ABC transporter family permease subunit [Citreicella sp. C3M06]MBU2960602.1 iron chelate uptake ABC transporter family permease subunit [Citreicella sp. C3M06]
MRGWLITFAALAALIAVSLLLGAASLEGDGWLLLVSRIPRTMAALLAGAGLALAGVVVQQVVQNRLVEPSLTGAPEASMLGLLAVTLIAPGMAVAGKMLIAAACALVGMIGFLALAKRLPRDDAMLLPIVGIVYGGILGAIGIWFAWAEDLVQYLGAWRLGEFSGVMMGRYEWLWAIAALAGLLYLVADRITILGLGETQARSLGLNYRQTRALGLVVVSVITALVLVTVGAFPFVGLVAPNLVARWRGDNLRANLPMVAIGGGALLLGADVIGRAVRYPFEIPAATVIAVLGAGVFLWLLHAAPRARHG